MNAQDFVDWLAFEKLNDVKAAEKLGVSRNSIAKYKVEGAPLTIELACNAVTYRLPSWKHSNK